MTLEHPFYVRVHGARSDTSGEGADNDTGVWTAAQDLRPGDEVLRPDGTWARVEAVEQRTGGATVYNFEVAQNHNYFVGQRGTLVHNQCAVKFKGSLLEAEDSLTGELLALATFENGTLDLALYTAEAKSSIPGKTVFGLIYDSIVEQGHNIERIRGNWNHDPRYDEMPEVRTNIGTFNNLLHDGLPIEEAARGTFTGKMAARDRGYDIITIERLVPSTTPGRIYDNATIAFSRRH